MKLKLDADINRTRTAFCETYPTIVRWILVASQSNAVPRWQTASILMPLILHETNSSDIAVASQVPVKALLQVRIKTRFGVS